MTTCSASVTSWGVTTISTSTGSRLTSMTSPASMNYWPRNSSNSPPTISHWWVFLSQFSSFWASCHAVLRLFILCRWMWKSPIFLLSESKGVFLNVLELKGVFLNVIDSAMSTLLYISPKFWPYIYTNCWWFDNIRSLIVWCYIYRKLTKNPTSTFLLVKHNIFA